MNFLFGLFLFMHGLIHASYLAPNPDDPKYPFALDKGWFALFAGKLAAPIGIGLVALTMLALVLAGLAVLGTPVITDIQGPLIAAGAICSLVTLILYWHPWLTLGILVDAALLLIVWQGWNFSGSF